MYCQNCGKELSDGSLFCDACGAEIISAASPAQTVQTRQITGSRNKAQVMFANIIEMF